jgi:hypothetical protein
MAATIKAQIAPDSIAQDVSEYVSEILKHYPEKTSRYKGGNGFVYIAVMPDWSSCKIGWSLNPEHRVKKLPYLKMIHYFPGDLGVEAALQARFADYALPHERFIVRGEMLDFLKMLLEVHGDSRLSDIAC